MPGCGMHSRPKLAEKARYNSLTQNEVNSNNNNNNNNNAPFSVLISKAKKFEYASSNIYI